MVIVLSKLDEWAHLLETDDGDPCAQGNLTGVDAEKIERRSGRLRELLRTYCPETVAAAETFAKDITYIAVSSLGSRVEPDPTSGLSGIRPRKHPSSVVHRPPALFPFASCRPWSLV